VAELDLGWADGQDLVAPPPSGFDCWDHVEKAVAAESEVSVARVAMVVAVGPGPSYWRSHMVP
jgi:hypothetical protein